MSSICEAAVSNPRAVEEFALRWGTAWNDHDGDAVAALCAEDLVYDEPALGDTVYGRDAIRNFTGEPQRLNLPSAPKQPLHYASEPDRPQPRLDRDREHGMAVTVGRLRPCPLLDIRMVALVHNTIRGAAGAALLNAELLDARGFL